MKKINFNEVIKEIVILTVAVAIIAAAVYFFPCTESYVRQQYFRSGYCLGEFCAAALVSDYYDFECSTADHRFFDMRQGIRCENRLHQYYAACFYRYFEKCLRVMIP